MVIRGLALALRRRQLPIPSKYLGTLTSSRVMSENFDSSSPQTISSLPDPNPNESRKIASLRASFFLSPSSFTFFKTYSTSFTFRYSCQCIFAYCIARPQPPIGSAGIGWRSASRCAIFLCSCSRWTRSASSFCKAALA